MAHRQLDAAVAGPAAQPRGVTVHRGVIRHIGGDDRARANEAIAPQGHAAHDRRVGANGSTTLDQRAPVLRLALDEGARIEHISEYHRRAAEHVVLEDHPGVDRYIVLDLAAVADDTVGGDDDVLADIDALANRAVLHDVTEVPDARTRTDLAGAVDDRGFVRKVIHEIPAARATKLSRKSW